MKISEESEVSSQVFRDKKEDSGKKGHGEEKATKRRWNVRSGSRMRNHAQSENMSK
jgi:hypothetical protein